jgi:hypothetical protein
VWLGFGRCRRTGLLHRTVAKYAGFDLGEGLLLIDVLSRASLKVKPTSYPPTTLLRPRQRDSGPRSEKGARRMTSIICAECQDIFEEVNRPDE